VTRGAWDAREDDADAVDVDSRRARGGRARDEVSSTRRGDEGDDDADDDDEGRGTTARDGDESGDGRGGWGDVRRGGVRDVVRGVVRDGESARDERGAGDGEGDEDQRARLGEVRGDFG